MSISKQFGQISELIEQAELGSEPACRAIRMASEFADIQVNDSTANFYAGYAWYVLANSGSHRNKKVQLYLSRAIRIDPSNAIARMYLGHYKFDTGDFRNALEHFDAVDFQDIGVASRPWRRVKLQELTICCKLHIDPSTVAEIDVQRLRRAYNDLDDESVPVPEELARTFVSAIQSIPGDVCRMLRRFFKESTFFEDLVEAYPDLK